MDGVAGDGVVEGGAVPYADTVALVVSDDVALTDHVLLGSIEESDAMGAVSQIGRAAGISTNVVADDGVVVGTGIPDDDTSVTITADDTVLPTRIPADGVILGTT